NHSAFDVKDGPWPVSTHGVIGPANHEIKVDGIRSLNGIGMHPPNKPGYAAAKYRLDKRAAVFKSAVALNDTAQLVASQAVVEVYGDGKRLWQSTPVGKGTESEKCSI